MRHRLILVGCGTVGQGLLEILRDRAGELQRRHDAEFVLVGVCDLRMGSARDPGGLEPGAVLDAAARSSFEGLPAWDRHCAALELLPVVDADVVVEATHTDLETGEPALSHVRTALQLGRSVVTTNKGPVALAYRELQALAQGQGVFLRCEGTVMSGTPVLSLAERDLAGDRIVEIRGILNGTTNYILTKMESGETYEAALAEAQHLGYAEANPDADVDGTDAQAKVMILSAALLDAPLEASQVRREGIAGITREQIAAAQAAGRRYKLVGTVRRTGSGVQGSVGPVPLDLADPLAGVGGVLNAVHFRTELLGSLTVVGPGAGRRETGFSLLSDLLAVHRARAGQGV